MIIYPRTQSCLFLDNLKAGYMVNIRYLVLSSKNGKQQDITMKLKDNTGRMISYQVRNKRYLPQLLPHLASTWILNPSSALMKASADYCHIRLHFVLVLLFVRDSKIMAVMISQCRVKQILRFVLTIAMN